MKRFCLAAALAALQTLAQAGIYTHVDAGGVTIMSNVAGGAARNAVKGAVRAAPAAPAPAGFPAVSRERQRELDGGRRAILDSELAAEQQALNAAAARRAEQAILHRHQANIDALQRELQAMR